VLKALEQGMRNHELVNTAMVVQIADLKSGGVSKLLRDLCDKKLAAYERGPRYDGYRLTNLGYDYLAFNWLQNRKVMTAVGSQIGIGKESQILHCTDESGRHLVLKIHRLGRTCFKKLKEKRDYHAGRHMSWIYLSRVSASKEFAYMQALHARGFPVPLPVDTNRHCVVMELVPGWRLSKVEKALSDIPLLYSQLMQIIVDLANHGVVHGDFNEFNIIILDDNRPVVIDFPQLVSTNHVNAKWYFDRDVACVKTFFSRHFHYESELAPDFDTDVKKEFSLDGLIKASGYDKTVAKYEATVAKLREAGDLETRDSDEEDGDESDDGSEEEAAADDAKYVDIEAEARNTDDDQAEFNGNSDTDTADEVDDEDVGGVSDEGLSGNVSEDDEGEKKEVNLATAEGLTLPLQRFLQLEHEKQLNASRHDSDSDDNLDDNVESVTNETNIASVSRQNRISSKSRQKLSLEAINEHEVSESFARGVCLAEKQHTGEDDEKEESDEDDAASVASTKSKGRRRHAVLTAAQREQRNATYRAITAAAAQRAELARAGKEAEPLRDMLEAAQEGDDRLTAVSFRSAHSHSALSIRSYALSDLSRLESKQVSKKALRAKGEASADKRKRKENQTNIRQSMACQDVWG